MFQLKTILNIIDFLHILCGTGSAEWVQRCRKLTDELEWLRDLTDKLTAENKNLMKDNKRLKRQLKTQEEDRGQISDITCHVCNSFLSLSLYFHSKLGIRSAFIIIFASSTVSGCIF